MVGARVALVIANDRYDDPGLRRLVAPAQDAAALAQVLADPAVGGFEVQILHNAAAQEIRFAVEEFFADRAPQDLLMLHFSGHGVKNAAGELFLAVADTKPTRLASTAVAADFVNRQMADSRAQRIALFLDCCYGGAFPRGMVVRATGEAQVRDAFVGQEDVSGGRGRVVVTASSAMEYAFEGGELATDASAPSVFTSAVVDGLTTGEADRDGDGWVGLTELVGYVTDRVHRVTPHQNPQMWTFGAQGELLIARSRIRRITPAPLAPELLEAMESPLPAARFGAVDYLRERLLGSDLSRAFAAWQALRPMVDDDSRRVALAATEALEQGVPRMIPDVLDLGTAGEGEVRLEGPPIALTAVASSSVEWLSVEQDGTIIRVRADEPAGQESSVLLTGPTGEWTIPVRLTMPDTESEPPPPPPEPEPEPPEPAPQPEPPHVEPPRQKQPEPVLQQAPVFLEVPAEPRQVAPGPEPGDQGAPAPPWWLIGVLIVGAVILIRVNWPGAEYSRLLWKDADVTGWRVYRTWYDPVILASFAALVASVVARWSGTVALGVVAGCTVALLQGGLTILAGGISYIETGAWVATAAVAAGMAAVLLIVLRPPSWPLLPVPPPAAVLVVMGVVVMLVGSSIKHSDGISFFTVTPWAVLHPIVAIALAWPALGAVDARARTWLTTAVVTYSLLGIVGTIPALTEGQSAADFLAGVAGNALVAIGVLIPVRRLPSHP
jgi:hypothetical protein